MDKKMVQNDKTFCSTRSISQKPYIKRLSFMVHMYKMISPASFFIFSKFCFLSCEGGEGIKVQITVQNEKKKNLPVTGSIS